MYTISFSSLVSGQFIIWDTHSMQSLGIHLLPTLPATPCCPVRHNLFRSWLIQLLFNGMYTIFARVSSTSNEDKARQPGCKMEVIFTRFVTSKETALRKDVREFFQNEGFQCIPVGPRILEEAVLDILWCLCLLDRQNPAILSDLCVIKLSVVSTLGGS
jgi:hypothetical protein